MDAPNWVARDGSGCKAGMSSADGRMSERTSFNAGCSRSLSRGRAWSAWAASGSSSERNNSQPPFHSRPRASSPSRSMRWRSPSARCRTRSTRPCSPSVSKSSSHSPALPKQANPAFRELPPAARGCRSTMRMSAFGRRRRRYSAVLMPTMPAPTMVMLVVRNRDSRSQ